MRKMAQELRNMTTVKSHRIRQDAETFFRYLPVSDELRENDNCTEGNLIHGDTSSGLFERVTDNYSDCFVV